MTLTIDEKHFPLTMCFEQPATDAKLLHLRAINESLQIERDANGDLRVCLTDSSQPTQIAFS